MFGPAQEVRHDSKDAAQYPSAAKAPPGASRLAQLFLGRSFAGIPVPHIEPGQPPHVRILGWRGSEALRELEGCLPRGQTAVPPWGGAQQPAIQLFKRSWQYRVAGGEQQNEDSRRNPADERRGQRYTIPARWARRDSRNRGWPLVHKGMQRWLPHDWNAPGRQGYRPHGSRGGRRCWIEAWRGIQRYPAGGREHFYPAMNITLAHQERAALLGSGRITGNQPGGDAHAPSQHDQGRCKLVAVSPAGVEEKVVDRVAVRWRSRGDIVREAASPAKKPGEHER